ncbi:MAG: hypothetical protein KIT83_13785 [Bryobacterales bacterium]|nr:hypothetical protein [Bryobacterales bacterium]
MRTRFMLAVLLVLLLAAARSAYTQQTPPEAPAWRKYLANGLELYSDASPERARWLAEHCASLQENYDAVGLFPQQTDNAFASRAPRLQVAHFKDLASFLPFRIAAEAPAFHIGGRGRSLVLIQDLEEHLAEVAAHEFFHVYTEKAGVKLPVWAAEGLGEYYSTMRRERGADGSWRLRIGELVTRHERQLHRTGRTPQGVRASVVNAAKLFEVTHNSRHRGDDQSAPGFYAESWLLVHLMVSKSPWREGFPQFLDAAGKLGSTGALAQVYGVEPAALDRAAAQYLEEGFFASRTVPLPASEAITVQEEKMLAWELRLLLADVLSFRDRRDAARSAYERLREEFPTVPEIRESLANLALDELAMTEAAEHLTAAAVLGSRNGEVYHRLATLRCGMQSADAICLEWLRKALTFSPGDREFLMYAVAFALNTKHYGQALEWLQVLPAQPGRERFDVLTKQAYALYHLEDFPAARARLAMARAEDSAPGQQKAVNDLERAIADREEFTLQMELFRDANEGDDSPRQRALARLLDAFSANASAVIERGQLAEIRCEPAGISLLVDGPNGRRKLQIENPMDLMVLEGSQRRRELELTCGPASGTPVQVGYLWEEQGGALEGKLRILQFEETRRQP